MQYTEEQLNEIKNKMVELEERLKNLDKFETESLRERMLIGRELNELSVLLLGEPIKENNSDVIGIGSKFNMTLKSEGYIEDTDDYMISESSFKAPGFFTVTTATPLGMAVMGKREGDEFEYTSNGILNKGTINKRYKNTKELPRQKTIEN